MSPEKFALVIGLMVFAGGAVGLILQRVLPETFTTGGPRDMIGAVVGLLTLLSALVMGLLIWTALRRVRWSEPGDPNPRREGPAI
jgi:hypothetical protein